MFFVGFTRQRFCGEIYLCLVCLYSGLDYLGFRIINKVFNVTFVVRQLLWISIKQEHFLKIMSLGWNAEFYVRSVLLQGLNK